MSKDNIKSKIIQDFLFKSIKDLSKQYRDFLKVDCDMVNDEEMYIFIDSIHNVDSFYDYNLFLICLDDFKKVCEEFINRISKELPMEHLGFSVNWYGEYKGDNGKQYKTCELQFKIIYDE